MGVPHVKSINAWGSMASLSSAACEWLLMFMLFLDAGLSYFLTKFAIYCRLQIPCPLCSRIEHAFGENKRGYYWKLLCCNHREEISSSVYCSVHNRLANIHTVCPDCLLSVSRINKFNSESYRLLVAKLGVDSGNKRILADSSGPRNCSCCGTPLKAKSNAHRLLQDTPTGNGASKATVKPPLPRVPGRSRFCRRDSLKRIREKITAKPRFDSMAHVGYTELKINSDTESDFAFSDDDNLLSVPHTSPENQSQTSESPALYLHQFVRLESSEQSSSEPVSSEEGGLEEHGTAEPNQMAVTSKALDLASMDDSQKIVEKPMVSEVLSTGNGCSSENVAEDSDNCINANDTSGSISVASASGSSKSNEMNSLVTFGTVEEDKMSPNIMLVPIRTNDPRRSEGALMNSPLWLSSSDRTFSPRFFNFSPRYSSPRLLGSDSLGSDAVDMLQLASALERNDASRETVDGINVKEIEGESVVDRLKRQVEYDKKCMRSLFKELDEERGASAIAANQAMAMITRLQEEKAALHMEALQYLRMMEEQAEYDMEALEKANDLLAEREREIQDCEAELEIYRNNNNTNNVDESKATDISGDNCEHDFEEEKLNISRCMDSLEKTFHQNGHSSDGLMNGADNGDELPEDIQAEMSHQNGENGTLDNCTDDMVELQNRLQTLENSHIEILEHAMKSLLNGNDGNDGLTFLREIAFQLRDLRNFALKNR